MDELKRDLDRLMKELVEKYEKCERLILTESDLVNRVFSMILRSGIPENHTLGIHTELRPFIGKEAIRGEKWQTVEPINYAAKCDLVLIDPATKFWSEAYSKVWDYQTNHGEKRDDLRYWRFLAYPVEAFRAVFEFKIRVKGNTRGIKKDIKKLCLIKCKNPDCLTYLVILDRKGTTKELQKIKNELETEEVYTFSNIKFTS